jgi:maleate isomerase
MSLQNNVLDLSKPVLPINVATAWHALRSCGIYDQHDQLGRLFEEF